MKTKHLSLSWRPNAAVSICVCVCLFVWIYLSYDNVKQSGTVTAVTFGVAMLFVMHNVRSVCTQV